MRIKNKLVVSFHSKKLKRKFVCSVDYERDIEIDEGNYWDAIGLEEDFDDPEITIWGDLDENNNPTTENLFIQVDHFDDTFETIKDIEIIECE